MTLVTLYYLFTGVPSVEDRNSDDKARSSSIKQVKKLDFFQSKRFNHPLCMYEGGMQGHSSVRPRRRQDDIISQSEPSKLSIGTDMITKHKDDAVAYKWITGHTVSQERSKRRGANRAGKVACHSFANGIFR